MRSADRYRVFAAAPAGGNVAGVVLTRERLTAEAMQSLARDLAAPTTGFVALPDRPTNRLEIRFFTPRQEIDACGHVTVAAAAALRAADVWRAPADVGFDAPGGRYDLTLVPNGDVRLRVPIHARAPVERRPVRAVLGLPCAADLPCEIITTGLRHLIVPVADRVAFARYAPSRASAEALGARFAVDTVGLISIAIDGTVGLRDLCAPIGDLEEPASGTTAAAVADFLARHRGWRELAVRQGVAMGRPSLLRTHTRAHGAVHVIGRAELL
jgi:trans-2,3-dihydro-3-hydroxyanthranilate isomerase